MNRNESNIDISVSMTPPRGVTVMEHLDSIFDSIWEESNQFFRESRLLFFNIGVKSNLIESFLDKNHVYRDIRKIKLLQNDQPTRWLLTLGTILSRCFVQLNPFIPDPNKLVVTSEPAVNTIEHLTSLETVQQHKHHCYSTDPEQQPHIRVQFYWTW